VSTGCGAQLWGHGAELCERGTSLLCRQQIGEATEKLTRLESELTVAQDANFNASHVLGMVDRGARTLNHSLRELEQRLPALKTSNFLGRQHRGSRSNVP